MLANITAKATTLFNQNAALILTSTGVVGTVGTGLVTARATFKASDVLRDAQALPEGDEVGDVEREAVELTTFQKVGAVWPLYLPPVGIAGLTIASIIGANRVSAKQVAALAAAYSITEHQLEEYKEKALEKLGVVREKKLRDEISQDRVRNNPSKEVIIVANGDVLFYDMLTGRYFQSTVEKVKKAETKIHGEIYNYMYCSLSIFFDELGLPPTDFSDLVGWNSETSPTIDLSTTVTPDDRPCMTVSLNPMPKPDYEYKPY